MVRHHTFDPFLLIIGEENEESKLFFLKMCVIVCCDQGEAPASIADDFSDGLILKLKGCETIHRTV